MLGLQGTVETMPMEDLLIYLLRRNLSGTIRCAQGPREKSFAVVGGEAVMASSNDPREYLGQFLINFGHISEQQLNEAFETQKQTQVYLGRILTMIGLVTEESLKSILELKIRETILSLTEWTHGNFVFEQNVLPDLGPGVQACISLQNIKDEAQFRKTAWASIRQSFPRGTDHLLVHRASEAEKAMHPLDEQILRLAEADESIDSISLQLHATEFAFYQRLFALHARGIVSARTTGFEEQSLEIEIVSPDLIPSVLGERADLDTLFSQARSFLREGKLPEAEAVARRAATLAPTDPSSMSLLRETETALQGALRSLYLSKNQAPCLVGDPSVAGQKLSPAERYLLKRFDGTRSLQQVIRVSPIRELDALKLVERFVKAKLISMDPI